MWTRGAVESALRPAGGAWSVASTVSGEPAGGAEPRVALDGAGNAVAVWRAGNEVWSAARAGATEVWANRVRVSNGNATAPQLALDGAGNAVAVWTDGGGTVHAALRPGGSGRWLAAQAVRSAGAHTSEVDVAADGAGNALAVWNEADSNGAIVEAADLDGRGPVVTSLTVPANGTARVPTRFAVDPAPWASPLAGPPIWLFGDGASAAGLQVSHVYATPGRYTVSVTQADLAGDTESATASIVIAAPTLRNTRRPSIRGRARVGATLACTRGTWAGTMPIRYAYRRLRAGQPIARANTQRYRAKRADAGVLVTCRVVATNAAGSKAATSRPVRVRR